VPKTKDAVKVLNALELEGRVLVVLSSDDLLAERSFGNLPYVHLVEAAQLTAYEVLANDWIVFTTATVPGGVTVVEGSAVKAKKPRKKTAKAVAGDAGDSSPLADDQTTDEVDESEVAGESAGETEADAATDEADDDLETDDGHEETGDEAEAAVSPPAASTVDSSEDDDEPDEDEAEEDE